MDAKASGYLPYIFRSFQGFHTKDIKEFIKAQKMEIHLESDKERKRLCNRCGHELGAMHDRYWVKAKHLKAFNWQVEVMFFQGETTLSELQEGQI